VNSTSAFFLKKGGGKRDSIVTDVISTTMVCCLIRGALEGRINLRMATGLVPVMNLQLRAVETADLETRLKKLEQDFAREQERRNR
jgi:hypothetical protein